MKSLSIIALVALAVSTSSSFSYVTAQVKDAELNEARKAFREISEEKDEVKKYEKAKAFFERFPSADDEIVCCDWVRNMRRFVQAYEMKQTYSKCQEADKRYFASPNADILNEMVGACDAWLNKTTSPDIYNTTRLALATGYGVIAGFYKDVDRSFSYVEKALQLLAPDNPPKDWKPEDWQSFRIENIGRLLQYQQIFKLRQEPMPPLTAKVTDGPAYKDPNTYLLRAEANTAIYTKLNSDYNKLPDADKAGIKGKEILSQIMGIVEKLKEDYARVVALTDSQNLHTVNDNAKERLAQFCRHREEHCEVLVQQYKKEFGIK